MLQLQFTQSQKVLDRLKNYLPGGVHYNFGSSARSTIQFNKGRGSRVWDIDGNEHLDLFCKFGALIVGHLNEEYNSSLIDYMSKVISVEQSDLEEPVCERIVHHVPGAEMVRFSLSGTEAVQNALRLARAYSGKHKFVRFKGHYNGNADNILGGKQLSPENPVPIPYQGDLFGTLGQFPNILEEQSYMIRWNDAEALEKVLHDFGDQIGAVIMEPICINGGGVLPKPGYLERVRQLCDIYQAVLIFDEVITGFRVGLGGAQSKLGVTPDLTVFGKAISGGALPVSVVAGKKEIMQLYADYKVLHGGTFNGYQLGLASILSTLEMLEADSSCYERMEVYLNQIGQALIDASEKAGLPMVVQGTPCALVFHCQKKPLEYPGEFDDNSIIRDVIVAQVCQSFGIQLAPVSRMFSNLLLNDSDVLFFKERINEAIPVAKETIEQYMAELDSPEAVA